MAYAVEFGAGRGTSVKDIVSKLAYNIFIAPAEARAAKVRQEIQALEALSDAELSSRGIARDGIAEYVLRGRFAVA